MSAYVLQAIARDRIILRQKKFRKNIQVGSWNFFSFSCFCVGRADLLCLQNRCSMYNTLIHMFALLQLLASLRWQVRILLWAKLIICFQISVAIFIFLNFYTFSLFNSKKVFFEKIWGFLINAIFSTSKHIHFLA